MRCFLKIAYRGSGFHGWQRQPNAISVQQTIEEALQTVLKRCVSITGAGRTDTGVHAREMFAHFDCDLTELERKERLISSLNTLCGKDIAIYDILPVRPDASARFDATRRTYKYFVTFGKSPFLSDLAWRSAPLDLDRMNDAARLLTVTSDFTSFAKLHSDTRTNICHVDTAVWEPTGTGAVFTISADRFLRNMVRAITGTLVEVGRGKMDSEGFRRVIERKDRCAAGTSMPAHALYLWEVEYPADIFI